MTQPPSSRPLVVALLGAESTGKTTLSLQLGAALQAEGRRVAVVAEYLREFCDRHRRTPRADEQAAIAAEQTRRVEAAAQANDLVVADTTALMTAVHSEFVFGDTGLYAGALQAHARCGLSLLTALDLPWAADGLQRDGPHVRAPVDALVRRALEGAGQPYSVIFGVGAARLQSALRCIERALQPPAAPEMQQPDKRWRWHCERCDEPDCERHPLPRR